MKRLMFCVIVIFALGLLQSCDLISQLFAPPSTSTAYTLTVNSSSGGTITTPTSSPISVGAGVATSIAASANSGYSFANWTQTSGTGTASFASSTSASTTVTVNRGDATIQANFSEETDAISIKSITPNAGLTNGQTYQFTIAVDYQLSTVAQGVLMVGFNTGTSATTFIMNTSDQPLVSPGSGAYTFHVSSTAKYWSSPDSFQVYVNLSEYPHASTWTPLATDEANIGVMTP